MVFKTLCKYLILDMCINMFFKAVNINFLNNKFKMANNIRCGESYKHITSPKNELTFEDCKIIDVYEIPNCPINSDRPSIMVLFSYENIVGLSVQSKLSHTTIIEPLDNLKAKFYVN